MMAEYTSEETDGVPPLVGVLAITGTVAVMVIATPLVIGNMCLHMGRELLDEALDVGGRAIDKYLIGN